jgi:hypothetical protein
MQAPFVEKAATATINKTANKNIVNKNFSI